MIIPLLVELKVLAKENASSVVRFYAAALDGFQDFLLDGSTIEPLLSGV